jgi:hypothetical protein
MIQYKSLNLMKTKVFSIILALFFGGLPLVHAERETLPQQQPVSLQFMASLFQALQEISPDQAEKDRDFDRRLRALLAKAQSLQHDYHRAEQGGMRKENERLSLQKEGEAILDDAFNQTEDYLADVLKNLKLHREDLKVKLLPQKKP